MVLPMSPAERLLFPDTVQFSYGMAWVVYDHRGMRMLAHGGAIDGFRTQITFVPDKQIGLIVLSNMHQSSMNLALSSILVDRLLDLPKRDWHAIHRKSQEFRIAAAREKENRQKARRQHGTTPSRELAAYAGVYEHPAYGTAKIELRRGRWSGAGADDQAPLSHFHYDTFSLRSELAGGADLIFALNAAGAVERFTITGLFNVEFRKVAAKADLPKHDP